MVLFSYTTKACGGQGRRKTGVFSQLRQFCVASGTGVSSCLCHKTSSWSGRAYACTASPRDLQLEAETKIAGRESFPSAVRLQEGSALCIYRAVKAQVRFLMHSTLQLGLGSLYVIE